MPFTYIGCVYLAMNKVNGAIYIGKSKHGIAWRRKSHERGKGRGPTMIFGNAIKKYGADNFSWAELFLSEDEDALLSAEISLISDYRAAGFRLYNATNGGEGTSRKLTDAEIMRMKGRKVSEAAKERQRLAWTPERRAAQAEAMRNRVVTQQSRDRMSSARKGMKFTSEHCESIRRSKLGNQNRLGTGGAAKRID